MASVSTLTGQSGSGSREARGGRHALVGDGERCDDGLDRAGGAERVSRGALHRHHRHLATRLLAAQRKQRMRLGGVVGRRSRAVGVDVAKVGRREAALGRAPGA